MKTFPWQKSARVIGVLAAVTVVLALGLGAWFDSRAVNVQRIDPHPADLAALLGEAGTPIGSPQRLLIFDDKAFVSGTSPDGAKLVSETYLLENNIYPLQWKTLEFIRNIVVLVAGLTGFLALGLNWFLRRAK
jgi:hypothetical protein